MKLIVGLGNPGKKYELTRHNAGFLALDNFLTAEAQVDPELIWSNDPVARTVNLTMGEQKILFAKPQTFMNNSGEAVSKLANFYKIEIQKDLLVVQDEIDLPVGTFKTAENSSAAGHNGISNIINLLGTQQFYRIRIGVESRENKQHKPTDAFVLENFTTEELKLLQEKVFPEVNQKIKEFIHK